MCGGGEGGGFSGTSAGSGGYVSCSLYRMCSLYMEVISLYRSCSDERRGVAEWFGGGGACAI